MINARLGAFGRMLKTSETESGDALTGEFLTVNDYFGRVLPKAPNTEQGLVLSGYGIEWHKGVPQYGSSPLIHGVKGIPQLGSIPSNAVPRKYKILDSTKNTLPETWGVFVFTLVEHMFYR